MPLATHARPTLLLQTQVDGSGSGAEPSHIVFDRLGYCTRAVNIRYNDETFLLNDGVFFRAEKVSPAAHPPTHTTTITATTTIATIAPYRSKAWLLRDCVVFSR